jgi:hypothetical protein
VLLLGPLHLTAFPGENSGRETPIDPISLGRYVNVFKGHSSTDPAAGADEVMVQCTPVRWAVVAVGLVLLTSTGCGGVNRRFVITSNVPNAQVSINNLPVGAAPAHAAFQYYGYYNIELVHPDCQRETHRVHVKAPWYAYPPFDFLTEVFWPFHIEDVRRYNFVLQPAVRTDAGELVNKGEELRQRAADLPAPEHPAAPREPVPPPGQPLPPPTPIPNVKP